MPILCPWNVVFQPLQRLVFKSLRKISTFWTRCRKPLVEIRNSLDLRTCQKQRFLAPGLFLSSSFFFLPTFSYSNFSPLLSTLGRWNLVCSFLTSIPRDNFFGFSNFSKLFEISRFFWLHNFGKNCSQRSPVYSSRVDEIWHVASKYHSLGTSILVFSKFSKVFEI